MVSAVAGLLALLAVVICATKGMVVRGLLAGLAIFALGVVGFLFEFVGAMHAHDPGMHGSGLLVAVVCVGLEVVIMAVAVSGKVKPDAPRFPRRPRKSKRVRRLGD